MSEKTRITVVLQKSITLGVTYMFNNVIINLICLTVSVDISKQPMYFFKFVNLFKK